MKAIVATFNQEKALVEAFSVITILRMEIFEALVGASVRYFPLCTMTATTRPQPSPDPDQSEMPSRYANWRLLVVLPSSEGGSHFYKGSVSVFL